MTSILLSLMLLLCGVWYLENGTDKVKDGGLFRNKSECCCDYCCCWDVDEFGELIGEPATITATIDAPDCGLIDGKTITLTPETAMGDECARWEGGDDEIAQCDAPTPLQVLFACDSPHVGCTDMTLEISSTNSGCDSGADVFGPFSPDSCTCDPFSFRFCGFALQDNEFATDDCNCCTAGFCIDLTTP